MAKTRSEPQLKIIWAVDPNASLHLQRAGLSAIQAISKRRRTTVEPVYLMSTFLTSTPSQSCGVSIELARDPLCRKLNQIVGKSKMKGLSPLTLLTGTELSMRRKAAELGDYAKSQGADVILLATHGRKAIKNWFLGSFADAMLKQVSEVPLFIVNPHWKRSSDFTTILFPTEFSDESREAYLKVVDFSKKSRARIIIFHRIALKVTPELRLLLSNYPEYERIRDREIADCRARASSWARMGGQHQVKVTVCIDHAGVSSVADAILSQQRKTGGIIALASRSGDTPPFLIGGTTHAVVRGSTSAVWVIHPEAKALLQSSGSTVRGLRRASIDSPSAPLAAGKTK